MLIFGRCRETCLFPPAVCHMKPIAIPFFDRKAAGRPAWLCHLLFLFFLVPAARAAEPAPCKVALLQARLSWGDVDANLAAFDKRVEACRGCDLIIFPELFTSGCDMKKKRDHAVADPKEAVAQRYEAIVERMKTWAASSGALVIGSTIYRREGKYYNRLLAVFPDGRCQYYDKHNCFKKGSFTPGEGQLILEWKGHRIATYICYDLRFPAWSRNEGRYDTALYIANWPASRRDDWNRLLRERALENKAYILAVNCVGTDPAGLTYAGDSVLLSPGGETLGKCAPFQEEILRVNF